MSPKTFRFLLRSALLVGGLSALALVLDYGGFYGRFRGPPADEAPAGSAFSVAESFPVQVERAEDGHFWVEAYVNGEPVRMMIDTGATLVILTESDAARLGFDLWEDEFTQTVRTAGGAFPMAQVTLETVELGDGAILLEAVRAGVLMGGNDYSVLGLSFLNRLAGYEVEGDLLTLRP